MDIDDESTLRPQSTCAAEPAVAVFLVGPTEHSLRPHTKGEMPRDPPRSSREHGPGSRLRTLLLAAPCLALRLALPCRWSEPA